MIIGGLIIYRVSSLSEKRRLAGRATVDGKPAKRRIVVQKRGTLEYVASTMTDPATGDWEISGMPNLPERSLISTNFDDTGVFNAEVADFLSQVE